MTTTSVVSQQEGYALLDALVGIAITGIVLLFAVGAMRELLSVRKRLEADAAHRLELTAAISAIRAQLERPYPTGARARAIGPSASPAEFTFQGSYPAEGAPGAAAIVHLQSEINRNGKQALVLRIDRSDFGARSALLIQEVTDVQFSAIATDSPFVDRELKISIGHARQPERTSLYFTEPRFARPLCIAAPFEPACRP